MNAYLLAVSLGIASGLLVIAASRIFWVGWFMLAPLCVAIYLSPPAAAGIAGLVCGILATQPTVWGRWPFARSFQVIIPLMTGLGWGIASALAAFAWPQGTPAWGILVFPVMALIVSAIPEHRNGRLGNFLLVSQQRWLPAVHVARLGNDLAVSALLALSATAPAILLAQLPPSRASVVAATVAAGVVLAALAFAVRSYRTAARRTDGSPRLRAAAVSVDGDGLPGPKTGAAYRDVEGTIARYRPHLARAIEEGARLVVLPEVAVTVRGDGRRRWLEALSAWAREGRMTVVAGLLDEDLPSNQLVIADESGEIAAVYDKQHPLGGMEPPRFTTMRPPIVEARGIGVAGMICYDMDYNDLVRHVAAAGILAIPTNDWKAYEETHHRAAVWEVVQAGVPLVRSTGHGISSIHDGAGRVLARASSFDGPVVLVADVPLNDRAARPTTVERSTELPAEKVGSAA